MNSNRRSKIIKLLPFVLSMCSLIGVIYLFRFGINVFQVKHILVTGDPVQMEINKSIFVNNTLFFPTESVIRQLKSDNPLVRSIEIRKKYPSTLEFVIFKRRPVAEIITQGISIGIDEDNVVTEIIQNNNLPKIFIDIPLVPIGSSMKNPLVTQAIALITTSNSFMQWSTIDFFDTQSIRAKTGQTDILITQISDLSHIRDTLQTLMEGFRIKGTIPKSIDLRFGKPIVQF